MLVVEVKYLTWTDENLLRQVVYEGVREDKPAAEVRRNVPHPKPTAPKSPTRTAKRSQAAASAAGEYSPVIAGCGGSVA
jgi:hypothetical protein